MSEKYFEYIFIIIFVVSVVLPLWWLSLHIRLKHLQKLVILRTMKRQQKSESLTFFSSEILNKCCKMLFYKNDKNARFALKWLTIGKTQKASDYLTLKSPVLALFLAAHQNAKTTYNKILKQKKVVLSNNEYGIYLPILAHILFDNDTANKTIIKIDRQKLAKSAKAYYDFCIAKAYLFDGDMLSASQKASQALKYFQKQKYSYESSACYLLLGEIYRLSCVNDVAQTMIEAARKINQEQNMPQYKAKSNAALGMLMLFENRFAEAEEKFDVALQFAQTQNMKADIYNQKALLYIAQNELTKALKEARRATAIFENLKNNHGKAFSLQLTAQIYFSKKQYGIALKSAETASNLYEKNNNISAKFECLYLCADILFRQNKLTKSEVLLRQITQASKKYKHNFHIANAYSLLGLIYLRKKDLQRAKVLLQQSLHLEQRHRRCEGLVSDYTNLALIENLAGNFDIAKENLQTAMEYAEQTGNIELTELIKNKISEI